MSYFLMLPLVIFIVFACLEGTRAAGGSGRWPDWLLSDNYDRSSDNHDWRFDSSHEMQNELFFNDANALEWHQNNLFEGLGDPAALGPLDDLLQDNIRHGGMESSNDLMRNLSLHNDDGVYQRVHTSDNQIKQSTDAPHSPNPDNENHNHSSSSSFFYILDSSKTGDWDLTKKDSGPIEASHGQGSVNTKFYGWKRRRPPPWRISLAGQWTTALHNYIKETHCGTQRATAEIDTVADLKLTQILLSDDLIRRREAALTIAALFRRMHPLATDRNKPFKERPTSHAKERLGRNLYLAKKAVAKQLDKAPRTADTIVKKHLTPEIIELLNNQNTFQAGVNMICRAHDKL